MTIKELLDLANTEYPDEFLNEYYDDEGKFVQGNGDRLAAFIVAELRDTFDRDAPDDRQLEEAIRVLNAGRDDIGHVIDALEEKLNTLLEENANGKK